MSRAAAARGCDRAAAAEGAAPRRAARAVHPWLRPETLRSKADDGRRDGRRPPARPAGRGCRGHRCRPSWSGRRSAQPTAPDPSPCWRSRHAATSRSPYAKQHLWDAEQAIFTPGDHGATVELDDWPLGLGICYDGCFPEHARAATDAGALAYVCPSAYVVGSEHRRDLYYAARAIDNGIYCRDGRARSGVAAASSSAAAPRSTTRRAAPSRESTSGEGIADRRSRPARSTSARITAERDRLIDRTRTHRRTGRTRSPGPDASVDARDRACGAQRRSGIRRVRAPLGASGYSTRPDRVALDRGVPRRRVGWAVAGAVDVLQLHPAVGVVGVVAGVAGGYGDRHDGLPLALVSRRTGR